MPAFTDKHLGPCLPSTELGAGASGVAHNGGEGGGEGQGQRWELARVGLQSTVAGNLLYSPLEVRRAHQHSEGSEKA